MAIAAQLRENRAARLLPRTAPRPYGYPKASAEIVAFDSGRGYFGQWITSARVTTDVPTGFSILLKCPRHLTNHKLFVSCIVLWFVGFAPEPQNNVVFGKADFITDNHIEGSLPLTFPVRFHGVQEKQSEPSVGKGHCNAKGAITSAQLISGRGDGILIYTGIGYGGNGVSQVQKIFIPPHNIKGSFDSVLVSVDTSEDNHFGIYCNAAILSKN